MNIPILESHSQPSGEEFFECPHKCEPSSSLNNLDVTLVADKRQIQNLKAQARNLEANLDVL